MRALAGLFAAVLALGIVACGGAGTPPVQSVPTTAAPAATESPAGAPGASPAGTMDPDAQDEYDYGY